MFFRLPVLVLAIIFSASIFLFTPLLTHAANTDIVINEIGPYEAVGHEWIEIYNKGSAPVDLTGWKFFEDDSNHGLTLAQGDDFILSAGEYAVIVQNDVNFKADYPTVTSTIFDSSWGTLNESGEEIGLKDADGVIVELFTYIAATNFSLERKDAASSDYSVNNWKEHVDSNTVGKQNAASSSPPAPIPTPTKIVINEFVSDPNAGEQEWIELYNKETTSVDLTGWTLHDGAGQIAAPTSTIAGSGFFIIELSSNKLNNGGDSIILKNSSGNAVDQVAYGDWDDGNVANNAVAPAKGNATARKTDGGDTNNDVNDFAETTTPTKAAPNSITAVASPPAPSPTPPPPQPSSNAPSGGSSYTPYFPRDVVINEIVSDPNDDTEEFVELFNTTGSPVELNGWYIEEGSEARTALNGFIPSKGFFVIEGPKGSLNNAGDMIELFDGTNKLIDRVTYGTWDDGNVSNNATVAHDPDALARKIDGRDADNDQYDFVLTSTITKGRPNVISQGGIVPSFAKGGVAYGVSSVMINEIFPNPKGSDTNDEFIELKNNGTTAVDLVNWQLSDGSDLKYTITQGRADPNGFIVFKRSQTKIALNNTGGDGVKLFMPGNIVADFVSYSGSVQEEFSYALRQGSGQAWAWTSKPTPGKENIIEGMSAAPIIALDVDTEVAVGEPVTFDASDTVDPDGETMNFVWQFGDSEEDVGDSVEHRFTHEGIYTVTLTVTDASKNIVSQKVVVTVKHRLEFVGGSAGGDEASGIDITEIFPNPEGSDATEFIELFNATTELIDLSGLKLDDEDGGSRAYVIPSGTMLEPGDYMVFGRQDTKLALNNTTDAVRLLYPDGTIIREVAYDDVEEGASYALTTEKVWMWTGRVTPGEANVIKTLKHENIKTVKSVSSARSRKIKLLIETTLDKLRDEDVGDRVKVAGIVAVAPGVLGSQYFYIGSASSPQAGAQVYMYKKDFPKLAVGDRVEITGELSEAYGETRVKVAEQADIRAVERGNAPQPSKITIADVGEPFEGQLVQIEGEITDVKSSYLWVDDGSEEVKVYFKRGTGIDKKLLREGDTVSIAGIVQQTQGGYQIAPRFQDDVAKTGVNKEAVAVLQSQGQEGGIAETYLTATAGGITSIILGLLGKVHGNRALGLARKFGGVAIAVIRRKKDIG